MAVHRQLYVQLRSWSDTAQLMASESYSVLQALHAALSEHSRRHVSSPEC
jgi:hypothetical protein